MKRFLICLFALLGIHFSAYSQAGDLPAGYLGSVLNYSYGTQTYNYSFTPTTSGVDYVGFAFRQDPGFWTFTNPDVTAGSSTTNLLINGNLQYGGGLSVNTTNYGTQYIQAPSDWGVWYQNGTYPSAAGSWSPGQWYDGAVGSYDGIYQGINVTAGVTYHISFNLSGTQSSSNPSIEVGTYMGTCAAGTSIFTCVPNSSASMSAIAAPQATQSVGGAPAPVVPVTPPSVQFTDLKFSGNQIADTQWNVGSCTNAGGTNCQIYSKNPGPTYNLGYPVYPTSTQYIAFTATGDSTNPWHMWLYNSDGSVAQDLGVGHILSQGLGSDGHHYFFFSNANFNGTLFSTDWGMNNSAGVTINGTNSPTVAQTNTFASSGSTTPLAAGATGGSGSSAPTVTGTTTTNSTTTSSSVGATTTTNNQYIFDNNSYTVIGTSTPTTVTVNITPITTTTYSDGSTTTSSGTTTSTQSTTYNYTVVGPIQPPTSPYIGTNTNGVYITQSSGSINQVTANQSGHGNYMELNVTGSSNTVRAGQGYTFNTIGIASESLTASNYNVLGLSVNGSSNNVTTTQLGTSNSAIISVTGGTNTVIVAQNGNNNQEYNIINGNGNALTVSQTGNNHIAAVNLYGNGNVASVSQTGPAAMGAVLSLTNAGGPNNITVSQTGSTSQNFSLQQTCTNGAGCNATVTQGH